MSSGSGNDKGETLSPQWVYQFVDLSRVEAGELIAPGKLKGKKAEEFAALQLIRSDLEFALECFEAAQEHGTPEGSNSQCRALIFSRVVAYARPFVTGARAKRLSGNCFADQLSFNVGLHSYLLSLRNKHIAHSVNEFEQCAATTVMVGSPDSKKWRVAGIGFTRMRAIGLSLALVEQSISQVGAMMKALDSDISQRRSALYEVAHAQFVQNGSWESAPFASFPSRRNVNRRRS